jgi:hypothetical protein
VEHQGSHAESEAAASGDKRARRARVTVPRSIGRILLWACVAVVFVRGLEAVASGPPAPRHSAGRVVAPGWPDEQAQAFAVAFARVYLTVSPNAPTARERAVAGFLSQGLSDQATVVVSPHSPGVAVAEAMVAREASLGGSRVLLTVAAFMSDGRTLYLTVPVARDQGGGLSVFDLPSFSAPPAPGTAAAPSSSPLTDPQAGAISDLTGRFLAAYLDGGGESAYAYLLAPGVRVTAMASGLQLVAVDEIAAESSAGASRVVSVSVRVREMVSRAIYSLRYRVTVVLRAHERAT